MKALMGITSLHQMRQWSVPCVAQPRKLVTTTKQIEIAYPRVDTTLAPRILSTLRLASTQVKMSGSTTQSSAVEVS
jgi:negative regulator of sigma E activity